MAIHADLAHLSEEAIDEYIELARMGIATRKKAGGIYGYPTTLLLFCVIDALSNHLGLPAHSFGALNHGIFGLNFNDAQIERLKVWYRHSLAHNGMIAAGTILTPEPEGLAIELVNDEPVVIRVIPLFELVERAWRRLDKTSLKSRNSIRPKTPVDFSASNTLPAASSGSPISYKPVKI